jgi:STE24 endopeptidase
MRNSTTGNPGRKPSSTADAPSAGPADIEARRYQRARILLAAATLAVGTGYLALVLAAGWSREIAAAAARVGEPLAWRVAAVAVVVGVGHRLLAFPLAWLRGFWLPRRHGLLHQPFGAWLGDRLKAAALAGLTALVAVELVYLALAATPWWWIVAGGALIVLQIAAAFAGPVLILPLFHRRTALDDPALSARLLDLARRARVQAVGVDVLDGSRRSRAANAAVIGLGRTRRIVLLDTLVSGFTPDEVEVVLAHELAHHVAGDIWRGLALQAALTVGALAVADRLLAIGPALWGLASPADPAGIPWLGLVLLGLGAAVTPLVNAYSRARERRADDVALALSGRSSAFVSAMERLATLNLAHRDPHPVVVALLYSHPSIRRRIERALATAPARGATG